jgi:3',5'-cyclic AMP phosphodiesterase CpdA
MTGGRFAIVGDLQETSRLEFWREDNTEERAILVRSIAEQRPAFVVLLGDLVFDGSSPAHWRRFDALVAPLREARVPMVPILGNHDYWWGKAKNLQYYSERFPELEGSRWHRRRFESIELLFLDSNYGSQSGAEWRQQVRWFVDALARADDDASCRAALVFVHHPPFTNSSVTRGSEIVRRYFVDPFLAARTTRAMVSGHVHSYERFERSGKTFIVSGGGGGPRVRLLVERRSRYGDLYRPISRARRPFHYLSMQMKVDRLAVEVLGLEKGGRSFTPMETFDLALA